MVDDDRQDYVNVALLAVLEPKRVEERVELRTRIDGAATAKLLQRLQHLAPSLPIASHKSSFCVVGHQWQLPQEGRDSLEEGEGAHDRVALAARAASAGNEEGRGLDARVTQARGRAEGAVREVHDGAALAPLVHRRAGRAGSEARRQGRRSVRKATLGLVERPVRLLAVLRAVAGPLASAARLGGRDCSGAMSAGSTGVEARGDCLCGVGREGRGRVGRVGRVHVLLPLEVFFCHFEGRRSTVDGRRKRKGLSSESGLVRSGLGLGEYCFREGDKVRTSRRPHTTTLPFQVSRTYSPSSQSSSLHRLLLPVA